MHSKTLIVALSGLALATANHLAPNGTSPGYNGPPVTGQLGDAPVTTNNPAGVTYQAILPNVNTTGIRGSISGTSGPGGQGVQYNVNFYGFPSQALAPFIYHIHERPVPADGNCTGTGPHLDPTLRGEQPPCFAAQPQTCQAGDLAGKYGNITVDPFQTSYLDLYTSTVAGSSSFFGNRSVVVHTSNTTRLTCANFTLVSSNTTTPNTTSPSQPTVVPYTGGAATRLVSGGAILAGLMAFLL